MAYNKTTWENAPSTNTPINANNLNKIEEGIYQNSLKADQEGDLTTLTTTEKSTLVGAINELKGGETYSTSEVNTGKIWHNNKPIYRKVFVLTSPSSTGTWTDYTHNIANIDEFTYCSANINLPNLGHQYFADFYQDSGYYFNFVPKLTMFSARVGYSQYTSKDMTIVVEYTKTTD